MQIYILESIYYGDIVDEYTELLLYCPELDCWFSDTEHYCPEMEHLRGSSLSEQVFLDSFYTLLGDKRNLVYIGDV